MSSNGGRFEVHFEEAGIPKLSYTNDKNEAIKYAKEMNLVTDHKITIWDTQQDCSIPWEDYE